MFGKLGQYNKQNFNTFFFFNTLQSSLNYIIKHVPEFCVILAGVLLQVQEKFHKLCTGSQLSIFHWQMQKEKKKTANQVLITEIEHWCLSEVDVGPTKNYWIDIAQGKYKTKLQAQVVFLLH